MLAPKPVKLTDAERDSLWDRQFAVFNTGFLATMAQLDKADPAGAVRAFDRCASAARMIQGRLSANQPKRFSYHKQWDRWCDDLLLYATGVERSLADRDTAISRDGLRRIRERFYQLHRLSGAMRGNDWVYAFRLTLQQDAPRAADLRAMRQHLRGAALTAAAKTDPAAYQQALSEFLQQLDAAIEDDAISPADLQCLRAVTNRLLRQYGMTLE